MIGRLWNRLAAFVAQFDEPPEHDHPDIYAQKTNYMQNPTRYRILVLARRDLPPAVDWAESPFLHCRKLIDNGYVQMVPLEDGVSLYCDEDAISKQLPFNRTVPVNRQLGAAYVHHLYGPFVLSRHDFDKDEPMDLTDDDIAHYTKLFTTEAP